MRFIKAAVIAFIISFMMLMPLSGSLVLTSALSDEEPALVLSGSSKAPSILRNIDYTDVKSSSIYAKSAIYESGALEFMKGNGNRVYGIYSNLTVEQAIAIAYNMMGREAEAQRLAQTIDQARAQDKRLFPAAKMWSDGYIQLAYNEGVLTLQQYNDALKTNQNDLKAGSFRRSAPATRQDVAYYFARIIGIEPINSQTKIFNGYRDWSQADPHKVPYIEAMLQNRIMTADSRGYVKPTSRVTRAEVAQIVANAQSVVFGKLGYKKYKGTIESVLTDKDLSNGANSELTVINIRNSGGDLHRLTVVKDNANATKNELTGKAEPAVSSSVVNRNNALSLATTLKAGEHIYYIVNPANEVPYVQVINAASMPRHYLGKVTQTNMAGKSVEFMPYIELPFNDLKMVSPETLGSPGTSSGIVRYSVSNAARVLSVEGKALALSDVKPDREYVITVRNGVIESFDEAQEGLMEQKGLVSGIVRENNPSMGYITLYFEDGSGDDPDLYDSLTSTRNFTYGYEIPVLRDGRTAKAENILPGDQVFIRLDEDGYIQKMSARSYYKPVYGTVHVKNASSLVVKRDDGTYTSYPISAETPVYKNGKPGAIDDMQPGDRLKLLVQTNSEFIDIAGIELEKNPKPISAVYRGNLEYYDPVGDALAVSGVQEFVNGRWENTPAKGVQSFLFIGGYKERPPLKASGTAYFAVKKAGDGNDRIVMAAYRSKPQYETTVKDNLLNVSGENGLLELENSSDQIGFDQNTIAVKNGRLVDLSALDTLDPVKVSMEKPSAGSDYIANVLVSDTPVKNGPVVYRGRISSIDPSRNVTVESFAELNGVTWSFTNTPKTFDIDLASSRLLEDAGVGSMRDFGSSYIGQSVYIAADGSRVLLVSTAPYADAPVSGRIASLTGGTRDSMGETLIDPTGLKLAQVMVYNAQNNQWSAAGDLDVSIPAHAVVLKNGQIGTTSLLKPGDQVKIIRHSQSLNGILVLCD